MQTLKTTILKTGAHGFYKVSLILNKHYKGKKVVNIMISVLKNT